MIPKLGSLYPNTDAVLLGGLDGVPEKNQDHLTLHRDDEYFDLKPDPDHNHGDDIDDSFVHEFSCYDDIQPKPTQNEKSKLDVDPENDLCESNNSQVYVSLEVQGTTCTLTLSNLEEPVVIDDALKIEYPDCDKTQNFDEDHLIYPPATEACSIGELETGATILAKSFKRPRAGSKSLKMFKKGSSSNTKKMLKCTFVDPVKGKCRVKVLDQDRLYAHIERFHKKNQSSDSTNPNAGVTIPETEDFARTIDNQIQQQQQSSDHQNDKITTEIEFYFHAEIQCSDSADINHIAGIANPETETEDVTVTHTITLNQLEEPNNSDFALLAFQNAEKSQVSGSEAKRQSQSTSQAKSDRGSSKRVTKSNLSGKKRRRDRTKVIDKLPRKQTLTKTKSTRDTSNLLKCTHVDPVKGKCRWKLLDQERLDAHINRKHKKIPEGKCFTCKLCPFATRTIKYLTFHKIIHAGIKDATCEICGMSFRKEMYLLHHKRRKHGEPFPVHCNICEKGFNDAYMLKLHNYRNHAEGVEFTHRCSVCNEGFHSKMHLTQHMIKHAERTLKCDECPKAFQTNYGLKRHKRTTHTGIRPFACDLCNWKFCTQYRLDSHRSIHTQKRPFLCQECGFSCRLPGLLTSHLKVHANNHSLAEQGIEKAPRLAKPRNRRLMIFENTVLLSLPTPTATQTSAETAEAKIITQQAESQVAMD